MNNKLLVYERKNVPPDHKYVTRVKVKRYNSAHGILRLEEENVDFDKDPPKTGTITGSPWGDKIKLHTSSQINAGDYIYLAGRPLPQVRKSGNAPMAGPGTGLLVFLSEPFERKAGPESLPKPSAAPKDKQWGHVIHPIPQPTKDTGVPNYLRMGYTDLTNLGEALLITSEAQIAEVPLLRSRGTIKKGHGHQAKVVRIPLNFPNERMTDKLAQLLRQIRHTPFLPTECPRLKDQDIDALAIAGVTINTVDGSPGEISAEIIGYDFDWHQYFKHDPSENFGDLFCWPLFKYWCEENRPDPNHRSFPVWDPEQPITSHIVFKTPKLSVVKSLATERVRLEGQKVLHQDGLLAAEIDKIAKGLSTSSLMPKDVLAYEADSPKDGEEVVAIYAPTGAENIRRARLGQPTISSRKNLVAPNKNISFFEASYNKESTKVYSAVKVGSLETLKKALKAAMSPGRTGVLIYEGPVKLTQVNNQTKLVTDIEGTFGAIGDGTVPGAMGIEDTHDSSFMAELLGGGRTPYGKYQDRNINLSEQIEKQLANQDRDTSKDILNTRKYTIVAPIDSDFWRSMEKTGVNIAELNNYEASKNKPLGIGDSPEFWDYWSFSRDEWAVESFAASFSNTLAFQQPSSEEKPTIQFMGGGSIEMRMDGTFFTQGAVQRFTDMMETVNTLAREFRGNGLGDSYAGFLMVEGNPLIELLGVRCVLPLETSLSTVQGFPNDTGFSLSMVEFDPSQSQRERFEDFIPTTVYGQKEALETNYEGMESKFLRARTLDENLARVELYVDLDLPLKKRLGQMIDELKSYVSGSPLPPNRNFLKEYVNAPKEIKDRILALKSGTWEPGYADPDFYCVSEFAVTPKSTREQMDAVLSDAGMVIASADGTRFESRVGHVVHDEASMLEVSEGKLLPEGQKEYNQKVLSDYEALESAGPTSFLLRQEAINQCADHTADLEYLKLASQDKNNPDRFSGIGQGITVARPGASASSIPVPPASGILAIASLNGLSPKQKFKAVEEIFRSLGDPHYSVGAAQWALESAWGRKESGKNNFFGIKAVGNQKGTRRRTREEINGQLVSTSAVFVDFPTVAAGMVGRMNFLKKYKRYDPYFAAPTPLEAIKALKAAGYATDSSYVEQLAKIVEQYGSQGLGSKADKNDNRAWHGGYGTAAGGFAQYSETEAFKDRATIAAKDPSIPRPKDLESQFPKCFEDHVNNDMGNRLLHAFPCYFVMLVDGGRWLGYYRLYDRLFGMYGVSEIEVVKDREDPAHLAIVSFSNMYGRLTDRAAETERMNKADRRWTFADISAALWQYVDPHPSEYVLELRAQTIKSLLLKAGSRIHVRMGYGSNASKLPTVFNGTIMDVPVVEGMVQVVAVGDGHELKKEIAQSFTSNTRHTEQAYVVTGLAGAGKDPRNIILELFTQTAENMFGEIANRLSGGKYFNNNVHGIEHFGRPTYYDRLDGGGVPLAGGIGAAAGVGVAATIGLPVIGAAALATVGSIGTAGLGVAVDSGEVGVNIYEPRYDDVAVNRGSAASNVVPMFWSDSDVLIGLNLEGATPWKVIETCRKACPDFIAAVEPFGLRSTLFFGKPWFDLYYDYDYKKMDKDMAEARLANKDFKVHASRASEYMVGKPFQQIRILSSGHNLLETKISTSTEELYTAAQFAEVSQNFMGPDTLSPSSLKYFDNEIYTQHIKVKTGKSGLYTRGMAQLVEFGRSFGTNAGTFFLSSKPNENYALSELKDSMKKMYQGHFLVRGDASLKPYGLFVVADESSGVQGACEARVVVHRMSIESGFTSTVTPDLLVTNADSIHVNKWLWALRIGGGVLLLRASYIANAILMRRLLSDGGILGKGINGVVNGILAVAREKMDPSAYDDFARKVTEVAHDLKNQNLFQEGRTSKVILDEISERVKEKSLAAKDKGAAYMDDIKTFLGEVAKEYEDHRAMKNAAKAKEILAKAGGKGITGLKQAAQSLGSWALKSQSVRGAISLAKGGLTIGLAIETFGAALIVPTFIEAVSRKLASRKSCVCAPLKIRGRELSAGIEGHKGGVIGDKYSALHSFILNLTNPEYSKKHGNSITYVIASLAHYIGGVEVPANTNDLPADHPLKGIYSDDELKDIFGLDRSKPFPSISELGNTQSYAGSSERPTIEDGIAGARFGAGKSDPAIVQKILSVASSLLGKPYVWGATGPNAFDCSGYVQYVLKAVGISVPRTAAQQYMAGPYTSSIERGDLVFFEGTGGRKGITHVGIYIGEGKFVHAPNSRSVVRVDSMKSGYYSKHFVGATRPYA